MKKHIALGTLIALAMTGASANAEQVFFDGFNDDWTPTALPGQFTSGATTGFTMWPLGASGDMDAGFYSVVTRARDVHSQFSDSLDAMGNVEGRYAIYNGFSNLDGDAYVIRLTNLTIGGEYQLSAAMLTLAPNPPYPQISLIRFLHNNVALGADLTLDPVPSGLEMWTEYGRNFIATGDDVLVIRNLGSASNAGNDFGLDNITVTAVPAPGAAALLGVGGLVLARRRRK